MLYGGNSLPVKDWVYYGYFTYWFNLSMSDWGAVKTNFNKNIFSSCGYYILREHKEELKNYIKSKKYIQHLQL